MINPTNHNVALQCNWTFFISKCRIIAPFDVRVTSILKNLFFSDYQRRNGLHHTEIVMKLRMVVISHLGAMEWYVIKRMTEDF